MDIVTVIVLILFVALVALSYRSAIRVDNTGEEIEEDEDEDI